MNNKDFLFIVEAPVGTLDFLLSMICAYLGLKCVIFMQVVRARKKAL